MRRREFIAGLEARRLGRSRRSIISWPVSPDSGAEAGHGRVHHRARPPGGVPLAGRALEPDHTRSADGRAVGRMHPLLQNSVRTIPAKA
jgi:hypothetical protein